MRKNKTGIYCRLKLAVSEASSGRVIEEREEVVHSFVRNFMEMLYHGSRGDTNMDYVNAGNGANAAAAMFGEYSQSSGMYCIGGAGEIHRGIAVGSSNIAFALSQYNLQSPIAHGTATGDLLYSQVPTPDVPVFSDPNIVIILSRDFANSSGSSVTVREIGLFGSPNCSVAYLPSGIPILYLRDVVADVVVADGQVLNVQYVFKTVVE